MTSTPARAAVLFFDDFSTNGPIIGTTPDVSSGPWVITGTSVVNPVTVSSGVVTLTTTGQDVNAPLTAAVANPGDGFVATRADITVNSAAATGDYFLHLGITGNTSLFFQRLFARSSGGGYQLGLVDTSGGATTWGSTVLTFGQSYDVGVLWDFVPGALNDTFAVKVNGSPYLTHTWASASAEPATLSSVSLRQGTASSAPGLTIDNLSVAIPEPSTIILGSVFGLLGLARRRQWV